MSKYFEVMVKLWHATQDEKDLLVKLLDAVAGILETCGVEVLIEAQDVEKEDDNAEGEIEAAFSQAAE